jgi:iron complex transport system substrate-binding protein
LRIRLITIMSLTAAAVAAGAIAGCSSGSTGTGNTVATSSPGSAGTAGFPVTMHAGNGAVILTSDPARIVSLSPTATEDLYAVGAGKQVVAVDETSDYPAGVPKTSLSGIDPNIEAIARYNPSLVIAQENANGLVAGLRKLGVPVLVEPAATSIAGAYDQIGQIGQATGHADQAASLVTTMKTEIAADLKKAGTRHQDLTYYWEVSANPYYSATSATFIGQVASLFGLKNIADAANKASDGGYPELSQEYIVTAKPQLIFLADNATADGGQTPALVAKRPGWPAIPAVKDNEVTPLNDDVASRWGPRLPQLVAAIASAVEKASAQNTANG